MKRLSIDRSGGQTQNFKQRIKLLARNLLTVVMLSRIAFLRKTKENVVLHDGMSFSGKLSLGCCSAVRSNALRLADAGASLEAIDKAS